MRTIETAQRNTIVAGTSRICRRGLCGGLCAVKLQRPHPTKHNGQGPGIDGVFFCWCVGIVCKLIRDVRVFSSSFFVIVMVHWMLHVRVIAKLWITTRCGKWDEYCSRCIRGTVYKNSSLKTGDIAVLCKVCLSHAIILNFRLSFRKSLKHHDSRWSPNESDCLRWTTRVKVEAVFRAR